MITRKHANLLNSYFASVCTKEDNRKELLLNASANLLYGSTPSDPFDFNGPQINSKLTMVDIPEEMVKEHLSAINPFKSSSPECIHPRVLKECSNTLSLPILSIFQQSVKTGTVPEVWKRGTVTPLYKNGDRHSPKNYRPVTLTSVLCRTLERIIKEKTMEHVIKNNIMDDAQHGFLPGRSCLSNLLSTLDEITDMMDSGFPVDEIFLDLQKAFDPVPHQRLIYKLSKL